jgi:hypothetical protein
MERAKVIRGLRIAVSAVCGTLSSPPQNYPFLTYTGQRSGAFSSMLLPPGYRISQGSGQLLLEVVPEPVSLVLVSLSGLVVAISLRSKKRQPSAINVAA